MKHTSFIGFILFVSVLGIGVSGCKKAPTKTVGSGDFSGFQLTEEPGSTRLFAQKFDANNYLIEEGWVKNNKKDGTWTSYHTYKPFPKVVACYENGLLNGPYIECTEHGMVTMRARYKNNELDGYWATFTLGRLLEDANYVAGKREGLYRKFDYRMGHLINEVMYKNGVQDGFFRQYNNSRQMTLEYQYKNGEKVSGGMVSPSGENNPD